MVTGLPNQRERETEKGYPNHERVRERDYIERITQTVRERETERERLRRSDNPNDEKQIYKSERKRDYGERNTQR